MVEGVKNPELKLLPLHSSNNLCGGSGYIQLNFHRI